jgi:hypothetical protein
MIVGAVAFAAAITTVPALSAAAGPGPAQATVASAGCSATWGSLPKASAASQTTQPVTNLRAGRHQCFDRLVVDLGPAGAGRPTYWVGYVDTFRPHEGAAPTPRGGARIQVTVSAWATAGGSPTYRPANPHEAVDVTGYSTFRQVVWAPAIEHQVSEIGLGVRARLPMRAFVLDGPATGHRLVIDVAHRW